MTFNQKLANYVLGNYTSTDLPQIAMTGIEENLESESLLILAGFSKNENSLEAQFYLKKALSELKIELKNEKEAAIEMIYFYADEVLNEKISVSEGINTIERKIISNSNIWREDRGFSYDSIGLMPFYVLYWQLDELVNAEYDWNLSNKNELILETEKDIKKELINWKNLKY
jgi:hypothetical protein